VAIHPLVLLVEVRDDVVERLAGSRRHGERVLLPQVPQVECPVEPSSIVGNAVSLKPHARLALEVAEGAVDERKVGPISSRQQGRRQIVPEVGGQQPEGRQQARVRWYAYRGHLEFGGQLRRMQWAGAFGDLGTLIPFVVAYITLFKGTGEDQALGGNGRGRRTFSLKR